MIGLSTQIIESSNPQIVGLNGRIIDETKSMFTINTKKELNQLQKQTTDWKFSMEKKKLLEGSKITKRPFDRIGGKIMTRNIGLKVKEPKKECDDKNCPFCGNLSIRGKLFEGR